MSSVKNVQLSVG